MIWLITKQNINRTLRASPQFLINMMYILSIVCDGFSFLLFCQKSRQVHVNPAFSELPNKRADQNKQAWREVFFISFMKHIGRNPRFDREGHWADIKNIRQKLGTFALIWHSYGTLGRHWSPPYFCISHGR